MFFRSHIASILDKKAQDKHLARQKNYSIKKIGEIRELIKKQVRQ